MSEIKITRQNTAGPDIGTPLTATTAISTTTSTTIDLTVFSGGCFQSPAALTNDGLTLEGSIDGTTWDTVRDPTDRANLTNWDGAGTVIVAAKVYPFPPEVFYYRFIRLKLDGAEAAARTWNIFLKS